MNSIYLILWNKLNAEKFFIYKGRAVDNRDILLNKFATSEENSNTSILSYNLIYLFTNEPDCLLTLYRSEKVGQQTTVIFIRPFVSSEVGQRVFEDEVTEYKTWI